MAPRKDYTVYAITDMKLTDIERTFDRKNIEIFLMDKQFDLYATAAQAMEAIVTKQAAALEEAPNIPYNNTAITCKQDKKREFKTYPAPMFFMQEIKLTADTYNRLMRTHANRADGYVGGYNADKTLPNSGPYGTPRNLPVVFIGKDASADVKVLVPDTKSPNVFTNTIKAAAFDRIEQLQALVDVAYYEAEEQRALSSGNNSHIKQMDRELNGENPDPGSRIIEHWSAQLRQMAGYEEFAAQLQTSYRNNVSKFYEYESGDTSKSAYTALETTFAKVQVAAAKKEDFETATAAKGLVHMAATALDDIRQEERDAEQYSEAKHEDWSSLGIYVPERDEW